MTITKSGVSGPSGVSVVSGVITGSRMAINPYSKEVLLSYT